MRTFAVDGRERAAKADWLGAHIVFGVAIGVDALPVQKVERGKSNSADGARDEILAGLLDAAGEELKGIAEGRRAGAGPVGPRDGETQRVGDHLQLVGSRDLATEPIEVDRREQ